MGKVVGVQFKPSGKVYDFDAGVFVLQRGENVVVETEQGLGYGTVVQQPRPLPEEGAPKPLKRIYRIANEQDRAQHARVLELEKTAYDQCCRSIQELGLAMRLFSVEGTFDGTRLTFYFTAEGRVDFRELVKMLVKHFKVRVELRQIGVRHEAKMCGGLGRCGREICCSAFMTHFVPVSVKMAKTQDLSLNPTKISGLCGRLMCCLTFEYETYSAMKARFPKCGRTIETPSGKGRVIRHNLMQNSVTVRLEDETELDVDLEEKEAQGPDACDSGQGAGTDEEKET